jgi:hypothetical protein
MGGSASRIWSEICAIDSDRVRAHMIGTVMSVPEYVAAARAAGYYGNVVAWMTSYQQGMGVPFPYRSGGGGGGGGTDHIQHDATATDTRYANLYAPAPAAATADRRRGGLAPPPSSTEMIVSPAAKALDYFQEALLMLGISEDDDLTHERVRAAYKRESLRVHPDKGGSEEAFNEMRRAYAYITKVLDRVKPRTSAEETARMTAPVTLEVAERERKRTAPAAPVKLSAKKLNVAMFNQLFEENRLPDPTRDGGYGDWMRETNERDEGPVGRPGSMAQWEEKFRERALRQGDGSAITKRLEPDAIVAPMGVELGGEAKNFSAAFGAENPFTDLKEAYTTGASVLHEVAGVRVTERSARSVEEAQRLREREMTRVIPGEKARLDAAAAALEERERARRMRLAQQDIHMDEWAMRMRGRLAVTDA